jgi:hypothetical protein
MQRDKRADVPVTSNLAVFNDELDFLFGVASFHAFVKEKPGRRTLSAIKLMKSDPAAMEAQREEIKARYSRFFGV